MLTGEVFKIITALKPGRYRQVETLDFCPVTLAGPWLAPTHLHLERLALIGAGAIGTAVALILDALSATGDLTVVDRQVFEPPNVISYSLGTVANGVAQMPKVDIVKAVLPHMTVRPLHGTVDTLIEKIDSGETPMPAIVLGAVDNIEAATTSSASTPT